MDNLIFALAWLIKFLLFIYLGMYKRGISHVYTCNLWNYYGLCLTSIGILIQCCIFKYISYRRELPICEGIRTELSEYRIIYSFIHQVSKRIFYRLAFGFVHFKSCLSSSTHTLLLLGPKRVQSFYYVTWPCSFCITKLGELTQWEIGMYLYSSPEWH